MSTTPSSPKTLKTLIARGKIVAAPGVYDALSALIAEQAGFDALYLTGNGQASSMIGMPDVGLITLTEMADRVRAIRAVQQLRGAAGNLQVPNAHIALCSNGGAGALFTTVLILGDEPR